MSEPEVLYSEDGHIGTEEIDDPLFEYQVTMYLKVGAFFGWTWAEFMDTPIPVVERLGEEIDFRLENIQGFPYLLTWEGLSTYFAIVKALGGFKKDGE